MIYCGSSLVSPADLTSGDDLINKVAREAGEGAASACFAPTRPPWVIAGDDVVSVLTFRSDFDYVCGRRAYDSCQCVLDRVSSSQNRTVGTPPR